MSETKVKSRFVDNGDETITDTRRKLMWAKDDTWVKLGKLVSWWQGQEYIKELNEKKFAGHSDWRFPNGQEARELYNPEFSKTEATS